MKILCGYKLNIESTYECDFIEYDYNFLKENICNYDILIPRITISVDKTILDKANRLKLIFTPSTGLNHLDVLFIREKGIKLVSLNDFPEFLETISSTAELSWGLLLNLVRHIPDAYRDVIDKGNWQRENFKGHELQNKTLGIIGFGRLGNKISQYANIFNMHVLFYDPHISDCTDIAVKVSLEDLLKKSEVITINASYCEDTYHMISRKEVEKLKEGVFIVNTSRGEIVDEESIVYGIEKGIIKGYATDVLEGEIDNISRSKLFRYAKKNRNKNIIITPHIGGVTCEAWDKVFKFIFKKMENIDVNNIRIDLNAKYKWQKE